MMLRRILNGVSLLILGYGVYYAVNARLLLRGRAPTPIKVVDVKQWQQECKQGKLRSCTHIAMQHLIGVGVAHDLARARKLLGDYCEQNEGLACQQMGIIYEKGIGIRPNRLESLAYFERSCQLNFARGCLNAGHTLRTRRKTRPQAIEMYKKALRLGKEECKNNESYGCFAVGWIYKSSKDVVVNDNITALQYYRRGCELGHGVSCCNIGVFYARTRNTKRNRKLANQYALKSCQLNYGLGCANAAERYDTGFMGHHLRHKAVELAQKACNLHSGPGCYRLGLFYEYGKYKLPKDIKLAEEHYKRACSLRAPIGCFRIGYMHLMGKYGKRSHAEAHKWYIRACRSGSPRGCHGAGILLRHSLFGLQQDCPKSQKLLALACQMGFRRACGITPCTSKHSR